MATVAYLHCGSGCGRRTALSTLTNPPAVCPNCGEPVTLLPVTAAASTDGYDGTGTPTVAKAGSPFNRTQTSVAKTGAHTSWRSGTPKS